MMHIERFCYGAAGVGTFGRLYVGNFACWTVEREWYDNKPYVSCLPDGVYHLEPYVSPRFGHTFALTQPGCVTLSQQATSRRWGCIFHGANRASELQGCIAPGQALWYYKDQWAVADSNAALNELLRAISATGARCLTITPGPNAKLAPTAPSPLTPGAAV